MGLLGSFDFSFGRGKKSNGNSKRSSGPKEYVSKLTGKRSREFTETKTKGNKKTGAIQLKGRLKNVVWRYVNVILSDINVLCSLFKPRVKVVYKEKIMFRDISELTIDDLYE